MKSELAGSGKHLENLENDIMDLLKLGDIPEDQTLKIGIDPTTIDILTFEYY